ncbi:MAG: 5'-3' exonuclease [Clostridia bacterium]|nr:5'-3' exonuclease [Clostridia bacterium]
MNRLLIVDGHNLLFQMFFGMPSKIIGAKGEAIQGVIGFVGAINRLAEYYSPTHLLVMFDGEKENPRKNILKEYKANRIDYSEVAEDENPFIQLPYIYDALDYMGIKYSETSDCETDDVIAAYAIRYGEENEVLISSFDSDYFQLITDNVKVIRYRGKCSQLCDTNYIKEKYGVAPSRYLDWKCLVGDTSDNIPGIRGIGPKTAAKLINTIGGTDEIIAKSYEIENDRIRCAINDGKEIIERNISLIKLGEGAHLPFEIDEIIFTNPQIRTMDVIHGIGH